MTSIQRIRMTRQDYSRLHTELAALRSRGSIEVADDLMDSDGNLVARDGLRQARIREIEDVLTNAVVSEDVYDPVSGPGMVMTIRYEPTGETETFLLAGRAEDTGIKVYSTLSPLGHAMAGARPGDQRIYSIPGETGRLVTLLKVVPYEMYVAKSLGPQSAHRKQR
ncbi:MAG TPA: GreA/GreB family elongation factor [Mycobacterium sp.]|uniref:GreA/GreB family elongation factor n=1 Tax=Mycobacterium sp. TaxID=1785 RepID=UPI002F3EB7A2